MVLLILSKPAFFVYTFSPNIVLFDGKIMFTKIHNPSKNIHSTPIETYSIVNCVPTYDHHCEGTSKMSNNLNMNPKIDQNRLLFN